MKRLIRWTWVTMSVFFIMFALRVPVRAADTETEEKTEMAAPAESAPTETVNQSNDTETVINSEQDATQDVTPGTNEASDGTPTGDSEDAGQPDDQVTTTTPETLKTPETPESPEDPEVPGSPDSPESPEAPESTGTPETPEPATNDEIADDVPSIPEPAEPAGAAESTEATDDTTTPAITEPAEELIVSEPAETVAPKMMALAAAPAAPASTPAETTSNTNTTPASTPAPAATQTPAVTTPKPAQPAVKKIDAAADKALSTLAGKYATVFIIDRTADNREKVNAKKNVQWIILSTKDSAATITQKINDALKTALTNKSKKNILVKVTNGSYLINGLSIYSNTDLVLDKATMVRNNSAIMLQGAKIDKKTGYTGTKNVTVSGGTWDGNEKDPSVKGNPASKTKNPIMRFTHAQNITIKNTKLKNSSSPHMIQLDGVKNVTIDHVTFENQYPYTPKSGANSETDHSGNAAVQIDYGTPNGQPETSKTKKTTISTGVTVKNSTFNNVATGVGTWNNYTAKKPHEKITIQNNVFKNIRKDAVLAQRVKNITVKNNKATNIRQFIEVLGAQTVKVQNNNVQNVTTFATVKKLGKNKSNGTFSGNIVIDAAKGAFVYADNTVTFSKEKYTLKNLTQYQIYLSGTTKTKVQNSVFEKGRGLYSTGGKNLEITGNTITGAGENAIHVVNTKSPKITGNTITGAGGHAICVVNTKSPKIQKNKITNSGIARKGYAISLQKVKSADVSNNTITGSYAGIHLKQSTGNKIKKNKMQNMKDGYQFYLEKKSTGNKITDNTLDGKKKLTYSDPTSNKNTMKNNKLTGITVSGKPVTMPSSFTTQSFFAFIKEYVIADMKSSGILASLTAAQAFLESGYGNSSLTQKAFNLFGIKGSYKGNSVIMKTQEFIGGVFKTVDAAFRKYSSITESIADHSALFNNYSRYANLRGETDYRKAATNVRLDGYATDPTYTLKLISIIKQYNLHSWDTKSTTTYKSGEKDVVVTASALNIRSTSSTSGNILGSLANGSIVVIDKVVGNWGRLADMPSGWVCLDYVKNR